MHAHIQSSNQLIDKVDNNEVISEIISEIIRQDSTMQNIYLLHLIFTA